ncbi:MAG: hypothetical protein LBP74_09605 [Treponema sp.]|jgi:cell division septum initiation protein DivIVA|nr:hypothetical protein [Treponema sp.]
MEDREILRHLLEVEAKAAALVDDAQAEADRRVAGAEKRNRERYEERYNGEIERLNREYEEKTAGIKVQYAQELNDYRKSLDSIQINRDGFLRLVEQILVRE